MEILYNLYFVERLYILNLILIIFLFLVCTRTIWLGHVGKVTTEDELRLEIEKYGAVESINVRFVQIFSPYLSFLIEFECRFKTTIS